MLNLVIVNNFPQYLNLYNLFLFVQPEMVDTQEVVISSYFK